MFIQKDFDENDLRAKQRFVDLFYSNAKYNKYMLETPTNQYTVDFYVKNRNTNQHIANIEVEVKNAWKSYDFQYPDVQLLTRKKKFWFDENNNVLPIPTTFVMFNSDLSNHIAFLSEAMCIAYKNNIIRNYGTSKTRNDDFIITPISTGLIGYFK
jgi:hypothetical protein